MIRRLKNRKNKSSFAGSRELMYSIAGKYEFVSSYSSHDHCKSYIGSDSGSTRGYSFSIVTPRPGRPPNRRFIDKLLDWFRV